MFLDRLTAINLQAQSASTLHLLTAQKNLQGQLASFLITCSTDGLSPDSIKYYSYQLSRFLKFCKDELKITEPEQITRDDIRLFILDLQRDNKPTSVLTYFKAVRRFINWLQEEKVFAVENNPVKGMKPPKVPEYIIRPFSPRDVQSFMVLTSGAKFIPVRNRAMLLTFLDTGLRLKELHPVQLDDVDLQQETIKVMGKGGRERYVRIGRATQKAIIKYAKMRQDNYSALWVSEEGKPLTKEGVRQTIRNLCIRAQVIDAKKGPHAARHYAATTCLRNGMDKKMVQIMLGHKDGRMTDRYLKTISDEDMIKAHMKASPVDKLMGVIFKDRKFSPVEGLHGIY